MNKEQIIKEFKEEIIPEFNDWELNTYEYSDRLNVIIHKKIDGFVSSEDFKNVLELLSQFDPGDFKTLGSEMYEGAEKKGFDHFCRVMLYCLLEQELWNDEGINELQNVEEINGVKLK